MRVSIAKQPNIIGKIMKQVISALLTIAIVSGVAMAALDSALDSVEQREQALETTYSDSGITNPVTGE